jgi:hypothetical protein
MWRLWMGRRGFGFVLEGGLRQLERAMEECEVEGVWWV